MKASQTPYLQTQLPSLGGPCRLPHRDARAHTVDLHFAVGDNRLDHALLLEVGDALARERAVHLHSVDEDGDGDEAVRLHILVELLGGRLVEKDGVLGLVLDLALGPLLLLLLCSSSGRL
ncbi:hypothetical protein TOPH_01200 [Tolypocladium ophioglossoides CBS 100239]|uniref:Uncharacterized protein n=1 Tax=Tolypocladium ophioglossoides (strain CBS 100239) TaxID=1163406 RepID=A0A0L0NIZ5_TOLOC|nr:hypothetical protein TOPH_01200 [Tolypocladium ophioglossoides CBS 100239]